MRNFTLLMIAIAAFSSCKKAKNGTDVKGLEELSTGYATSAPICTSPGREIAGLVVEGSSEDRKAVEAALGNVPRALIDHLVTKLGVKFKVADGVAKQCLEEYKKIAPGVEATAKFNACPLNDNGPVIAIDANLTEKSSVILRMVGLLLDRLQSSSPKSQFAKPAPQYLQTKELIAEAFLRDVKKLGRYETLGELRKLLPADKSTDLNLRVANHRSFMAFVFAEAFDSKYSCDSQATVNAERDFTETMIAFRPVAAGLEDKGTFGLTQDNSWILQLGSLFAGAGMRWGQQAYAQNQFGGNQFGGNQFGGGQFVDDYGDYGDEFGGGGFDDFGGDDFGGGDCGCSCGGFDDGFYSDF